MNGLKIVMAGLSLGLVVGFVLWDAEARISPGPLHPSHAAIDELNGAEGCAACHGQDANMATACAVCHRAIQEQSDSGRGLHGALTPDVLAHCGTCHAEHHGDATALVSPHAFAKAGVPERDDYDHRHVADFALGGSHAALACDKCHPLADADALAADSTRFLGLDSRCASCHDDPHASAYGADCAGCHAQDAPFKPATNFAHPSFTLRGAHARTACADCHPATGAHAVTALRGRDDVVARGCADCHRDPHDPRAEGSAPRFSTGTTACSHCHDDAAFAPSRASSTDHAGFGVPLLGAHLSVGCTACHGSLPEQQRDLDNCAACHASPHDGGFVARATAEGMAGCVGCHATEDAAFTHPPARLDATAHSRLTGFSLDAPHADLACAECHGPSRASFTVRFPQRTGDDCAACHDDPHAGAFDQGPTQGRCAACHQGHRFAPSSFDLAAHSQTAFALDGAHAAVPCSACHQRSATDLPPRFAATPTACEDCHQDPHAGRFDAAGTPPTIGGRAGCARCHQTGDFGELVPGVFDHARWTGTPLTGAHARASCSDCHGRRAAPDENGRTLGAAPTGCAECHDDPHGGQFASASTPADDCGRCHDPVQAFAIVDFDHSRDSRFDLDSQHASIACEVCHRPETMSDGVTRIRYRPLGTSCAECHGPLPRQGVPR